MKHLKLYEDYNYKWSSIYQEDDNLHIQLYKLSGEMLDTLGEDPDDRDDSLVTIMEKEYCRLIKKLLEGKVITFSCSDCLVHHTGICDYVEFEGGFQPAESGFFNVQHIQIKLEGFDEPHNIDDDEIIVHLDLFNGQEIYSIKDAVKQRVDNIKKNLDDFISNIKIYRNVKKYNL